MFWKRHERLLCCCNWKAHASDTALTCRGLKRPFSLSLVSTNNSSCLSFVSDYSSLSRPTPTSHATHTAYAPPSRTTD
jgi:hypothetical protein